MADRPNASSITDDQLEELHADLERARRWSVHLENENRRLEDELADADARHIRATNTHMTVRARAERAEQLAAAVRAECEHLQRETRGLNPHAMAGRRDAVARILAALDAAGQPDTGEQPQHTARGTNAEDCPACRAAATPPPYPFLCPGEPECTGCGDTGACAGGPCAHPDAAPSR